MKYGEGVPAALVETGSRGGGTMAALEAALAVEAVLSEVVLVVGKLFEVVGLAAGPVTLPSSFGP
jgi:hypothetical protein